MHTEPNSLLWGMVHTAAVEVPGLNFAVTAETLSGAELRFDTAAKAGTHAVPYTSQCGSLSLVPLLKAAPDIPPTLRGPYNLVPKTRGSLHIPLAHQLLNGTKEWQRPSSANCWVSVKAVGINFRDVLNILGMYPGDPGPPGGDFAGVVVKAGQSSGWKCGESVFGLGMGALGSHVLVDGRTVARMPPGMTFEAAAACPTVFTTVDCALSSAAGIDESACAGSSILIHAATGGVGLAACQVAAARGLIPICTAGSPIKRSTARLYGIQT
eukprot:scaffold224106_cov51-Prasinocladus_malaysianus.AAC.1